MKRIILAACSLLCVVGCQPAFAADPPPQTSSTGRQLIVQPSKAAMRSFLQISASGGSHPVPTNDTDWLSFNFTNANDGHFAGNLYVEGTSLFGGTRTNGYSSGTLRDVWTPRGATNAASGTAPWMFLQGVTEQGTNSQIWWLQGANVPPYHDTNFHGFGYTTEMNWDPAAPSSLRQVEHYATFTPRRDQANETRVWSLTLKNAGAIEQGFGASVVEWRAPTNDLAIMRLDASSTVAALRLNGNFELKYDLDNGSTYPNFYMRGGLMYWQNKAGTKSAYASQDYSTVVDGAVADDFTFVGVQGQNIAFRGFTRFDVYTNSHWFGVTNRVAGELGVGAGITLPDGRINSWDDVTNFFTIGGGDVFLDGDNVFTGDTNHFAGDLFVGGTLFVDSIESAEWHIAQAYITNATFYGNVTGAVFYASSDSPYSAGWNGSLRLTTQNSIYDQLHLGDPDDDGKISVLDMGAGLVKTDSSGNVSAASVGTDYVSPTGSGATLTIDSSGFNGNAATTDNTLQEIGQLLDDFPRGDVDFNGHSISDVNDLAVGGTITGDGADFSGAVTVEDGAYSSGWNGSAIVPTRNAVFDKIDSLTTNAFPVACSDVSTDIATGTAKVTFRMPFAATLKAVRASCSTAPTGSTIIVDLNEGGTTVLSTKLTIDATEETSTTAATPAVISDTALADDAEMTIDFDQVGSGAPGKGVIVTIYYTVP